MRRKGCLCRTTLCWVGQSRNRIHTACSRVLVGQHSSRRLETVLAATSPEIRADRTEFLCHGPRHPHPHRRQVRIREAELNPRRRYWPSTGQNFIGVYKRALTL